MKTTLALTLLLALSSIYLFYQDNEIVDLSQNHQAYSNWKQEYGQFFESFEDTYRFSVFSENLELINQHNASEQDFKLAVNQFAALTNAEFAQRNTKRVPQRKNTRAQIRPTIKGSVPSYLNWAEQGVVCPVQNQGNCGSCWAFGATSQLESLNAIKNGNLIKFSEQQVTSCTGPAGYSSDGCNGGEELDAFDYTAQYGIETEEAYPYVQQSNPITTACKYNASDVVFQNTGAQALVSNDPDAMINQLQVQPLSVGVSASSIAFQFYYSGVITKNCGYLIDHAVSLVGYNQNADVAAPYWIVKNSWGTSWGIQGYVWIAIAEGRGICNINVDVSYPTLN